MPTGGLSQATTAIVPASPVALRCSHSASLRHLAADQRVAHLARAVADAVGGGDRVLGLDQPQLELALARADAALELVVDRLDLGHDAEIALAVALGADDADRRLVDQVRIGAERARQPDRLGGAAGMAVDENGCRFHWANSVGWLAPRVLGERTRRDQPALLP